MIEFIAQNLAPIMFLSLIAFLLLGYPVAFSLASNGIAFFVIAVILSPYSDTITLDWPLLGTLPGRVLDVMRNDQLLAIPDHAPVDPGGGDAVVEGGAFKG